MMRFQVYEVYFEVRCNKSQKNAVSKYQTAALWMRFEERRAWYEEVSTSMGKSMW